MSWNDIHKLRSQKPELEQDLDSLSEFLVWDTEFKSKHLSDEDSNMLSQDISSNDSVLSQFLDTPEAHLKPQDSKRATVYGVNCLGVRVPIDSFAV